MYNGQKVIIVLPAFNAALTLENTFREIPFDIVDEIILVDDCSDDNTTSIAEKIGIRHIIHHEKNVGYGGNQKTCYKKALELKGDIIVMLHPDYQYTPLLIPAMVGIIGSGLYPVVFGSRILGKSAKSGGMPRYKYFANRALTLFQNILMSQKLTEYHTGFRAFSGEVLRKINFEMNSNDFIFDNEIIAQIFFLNLKIAEITCPTKYFAGASSINFTRSIKYGLGVLRVSLLYFLTRTRIHRWKFLLKSCNHE